MNTDPEEHDRYIARQNHPTPKIPWPTIITLAAIAGLLAIVWRITRAILRPVITIINWLVRLTGNLIEELLDIAFRVGLTIGLVIGIVYLANHYGHLLRHL